MRSQSLREYDKSDIRASQRNAPMDARARAHAHAHTEGTTLCSSPGRPAGSSWAAPSKVRASQRRARGRAACAGRGASSPQLARRPLGGGGPSPTWPQQRGMPRASQAGALCLGFSLRDMSLRGSCSLTIRTAGPPDSSVHWRGRRAGVSRGCSLTSNLKLSCRLVTPGRWRCSMWPF